MNHGCGSGSGGGCGCAGGSTSPGPAAADAPVARVNGVALHSPGEQPDEASLRQMACSELLRQAAQRAGLLDPSDAPGDVLSEAAGDAIEALLERELALPEPSEEACRRHHQAHAARFATGERVRARHVLFAVTPGVDVGALRQRAERALLDLRCHDGNAGHADAAFAKTARELSNCPSGAQGGDLGWLSAADCAPEFARELFGTVEVGVLPRLVHSRFGLHIVEVQQREPGTLQPFEAVRGAVAMALRQQAYVSALRQYLSVLAGEAAIEGIDLLASETPLVQ